jgi:hypothetical protein
MLSVSDSTHGVADVLAREPIAPKLYKRLKRLAGAIDRRTRITDRYTFDDRQSGERTLVCVICGDKPSLLPFTLPALAAATRGMYVCLVSPGVHRSDVADACRRLGWSYLATRTHDAALAQNVCYRLHADVELIVKIGEGVFLLPGSIETLLAKFHEIKAQGVIDPGVVAPLVTLDGACYRVLLERLGLLESYEARFGTARVSAAGAPIDSDAAASAWIWEQTYPLARSADRLAALPEQDFQAAIRFSGDVCVFERTFWEKVDYYPVYRRRLMVGRDTARSDADHLSASAMALSRPVVIASRVLAAKFASEQQYSQMLPLLDRRPELFRV